MFTPEQRQWIDHLSDKDRISIFPFDPTAEDKFKVVRQRVQDVLGEKLSVEHHGATSLSISGQNEIDIYIPVPRVSFEAMTDSLRNIFGEPRSTYPLNRVRFITEVDGKHVDVFLINEEQEGWKNLNAFEAYLRSHPEALEEYKRLKEAENGLSVRGYYRRKLNFLMKY